MHPTFRRWRGASRELVKQRNWIRGPSRAHEGPRSEDRGRRRRYRAGNDRPLPVERLSPGLIRGELGVDLLAVVVVVGQRRVDLRGSQVGIRLTDLLVVGSVLVEEDHVVDADPRPVDTGLAAAHAGCLRHVWIADARLRRGHGSQFYLVLTLAPSGLVLAAASGRLNFRTTAGFSLLS